MKQCTVTSGYVWSEDEGAYVPAVYRDFPMISFSPSETQEGRFNVVCDDSTLSQIQQGFTVTDVHEVEEGEGIV